MKENLRKIMRVGCNAHEPELQYAVFFRTTDGKRHKQLARNRFHAEELAEIARNHPDVNADTVVIRTRLLD